MQRCRHQAGRSRSPWQGRCPVWQALQEGSPGAVVAPGSPAYQQLPKPFNARFHDVRPQAIVGLRPQDVAVTIRFAGRHGNDLFMGW
jgi:hypothetical protein